MALVVLEDLNGTHYLGLQEGETLEANTHNCYIFGDDTPRAKNPLEKVEFTQEQADDFVKRNAGALAAFTGTNNNVRLFSDTQCAIIAYHRLLAVRNGLVSPDFPKENFFVDYTEALEVTAETLAALKKVEEKAITDALTPAVQKTIRKSFADRVAMVAFVFRARGHHYLSQYEELYDRLWRKCRYNVSDLNISYAHLATVALHAIFPVILDSYWVAEVNALHVNGALAKRLDVAPAGAAGPFVLQQGVLDLVMIAPGIRRRLEDAIRYLDSVLVELKKHRFAGSVNARYYNTNKVKFEEGRLAAIAATIKAALDALTDDAPLGKSPALQRIANNAPITGAVLGRAIGNIADRPEVVNPLLIEDKGKRGAENP